MTKMSAPDVYSQEWLVPRYGMYALDYANAFPDLTNQMRRLYRDRLALFPGLPADWWASINTLHGKEGKFLFPVSSRATAGGSGPSFLKTDQQRQAWDSIVEELNAVRMAMVNKERERGAALLNTAYNRAAFWENAYQLARVAALPVTIARTAWNNPWLTGTVVWGALAALVIWRLTRKTKD